MSEKSWKADVDEIINDIGKSEAALLQCLEAVQRDVGYITQDAITYLRDELDVPSVEIYGVMTFYGMLTAEQQGKYVIRVCNSLPCYLNGSKMIIETLENELGIKSGETAEDANFTLETVACLGLCDNAPAMIINREIYGNLTEEKVKEIIKAKAGDD
nr:putative Fe-only hydrogenase [uncultured archaeon]